MSSDPLDPGTSSEAVSSQQQCNDLVKKLQEFKFCRAGDQTPQSGEQILEQLPTDSSSGATTPAPVPSRKNRFSISTNSVIPTLLNAELNDLKLFDNNDANRKVQDGSDVEQLKIILENDLLSSNSSALMTKKELGKVVSGIRDVERTLNKVKIQAKIRNILIVTKIYDPDTNAWAHTVSKFLLGYRPDIVIYVQAELQTSKEFQFDDLVGPNKENADRINFWYGDRCIYRPEVFDLACTFGGDGTVLFACWLFQTIIPPVLSFSLGSLGFLTEFDVKDHERILKKVIEEGYQCSIRMRFECTIMKSLHLNGKQANLTQEIKNLGSHNSPKTHEISDKYCVFNEVVVDRGPNAVMTSIEMFGDRDPITTAEADGLIISTPSGSTAYSLSAGGSLVHPEIPGILISPICPHTLSFRPLVIPESIILRLGVPYDARATVWCSFDGKNRVELDKGDFVTVTASRFPVPYIKNSVSKNAWFDRISETLHWNERKHQKPMDQPDVPRFGV